MSACPLTVTLASRTKSLTCLLRALGFGIPLRRGSSLGSGRYVCSGVARRGVAWRGVAGEDRVGAAENGACKRSVLTRAPFRCVTHLFQVKQAYGARSCPHPARPRRTLGSLDPATLSRCIFLVSLSLLPFPASPFPPAALSRVALSPCCPFPLRFSPTGRTGVATTPTRTPSSTSWTAPTVNAWPSPRRSWLRCLRSVATPHPARPHARPCSSLPPCRPPALAPALVPALVPLARPRPRPSPRPPTRPRPHPRPRLGR